MQSDKKSVSPLSWKRQDTWEQYVKLKKYFSYTVKQTRSEPKAGTLKRTASTCTNLSLSWQLACDPSDPQLERSIDADTVQANQRMQSTLVPRQPVDQSLRKAKRQRGEVGRVQHMMKPRYRSELADSWAVKGLPMVVVVDATRKFALGHGARNQQEAKKKPKQVKPTNTRTKYGVPLCKRPTQIIGARPSNTLMQPLLWQQMMQQQQQQHSYRPRHRPLHHLILRSEAEVTPKYGLPRVSLYHNLRKGTRYCGNFYYKDT